MIAGGKCTTYRVMAKYAVDAAPHCLGSAAPSSVTDRIPVVGVEGAFQPPATRAIVFRNTPVINGFGSRVLPRRKLLPPSGTRCPPPAGARGP